MKQPAVYQLPDTEETEEVLTYVAKDLGYTWKEQIDREIRNKDLERAKQAFNIAQSLEEQEKNLEPIMNYRQV